MPTVSNATVNARSLKKAAAALPNSPRKNIETVKSLAKLSNLKVQYSNQNKVSRPSSALMKAEIDCLSEFFDLPDKMEA